MLKLVIFIAIAYMLWRMFESEKRKKKEQAQREQEDLVMTGEVVKDPVCGTYVDAESSISVRDGDIVHHFCSYECRDAFLKQRDASLPQADGEQSDIPTQQPSPEKQEKE